MNEQQNVIIFYDIKDNNRRTKIAKRLLAFGLHRIQYSVFVGVVKRKYMSTLIKVIEKHIDIGAYPEDKLYIQPLGSDQYKQMIQIGKKTNWSGIFDLPDTIIF